MTARRVARQPGQGSATVALMCLLAVAGIAWVTTGMTTREQWPVRWLEIDGAFERISAEQLRSSIAPLVSGSFFTIDLEAIRQSAYRQPWVSQVTVQKNWPDTIQVRITEHEPVAHWTKGRLLSEQGDAFGVPGADEIQGLPWLEGPDGQVLPVFDAWKEFNNVLLPIGQEVERIRLDPRGSWFVQLTSGTEIQIGREDGLQRLQRLVHSWPQLVREKDLAPLEVDLRYTNGFAVRWPEPPARFAGRYGQEN